MLGRIFSAAEIHDSTSKNINTIFPDISFGALGIHIATNRRMVILPSELLPHNVYNQNVISEAATILAISDVSRSIAKEMFDLYMKKVV